MILVVVELAVFGQAAQHREHAALPKQQAAEAATQGKPSTMPMIAR